MTEILTAAQMRGIERAAIESGEVTGLELMERAGRGVVDAILEEWPELADSASDENGEGGVAPRPAASPQDICEKKKRAVVLCGPGNNGGDGFVVARMLAGLDWEVEVFLLGAPARLPLDARVNYERWMAIGSVAPLTARGFRAPHPVHANGFADIYIDALFGTGITRPVVGEAWEVLACLGGGGGDDFSGRIVAIDAPSGLCLDSGRLLGSKEGYAHGKNTFAALTVAFDSPKLGHFLGEGPGLCGKLVVKDIGLRPWREADRVRIGDRVRRVMRRSDVVLAGGWFGVEDDRAWTQALVLPHKDRHQGRAGQAHKFSYGHVLAVTGGFGRTGAARLSARAALRVGAGLVSLAVPSEALGEVAAQITALMMGEANDAGELSSLLADQRLTALCIGPGLGLSQSHAEMVGAALAALRPTVLDADALSLVAQHDHLRAALHDGCILTPHMGEFARLFPDLHARLVAPRRPVARPGEAVDLGALLAYTEALKNMTGPAFSKVDAVREAATRVGCAVLLKGPDTVIATPDGRVAVHAAVYDRAAPWLATAGSGDVLSGMIAGLLAMGVPVFSAAATGAWLHVECARQFGFGLIAEDLPEQLPKVLSAGANQQAQTRF